MADAEVRNYPETYYRQHRNTILFCIVLLLISLPHVSIDLGGFLFVESRSALLSTLVPWLVWIAATYSFFHFYLEWRDHALPHGRAIRSNIDEFSKYIRELITKLHAVEGIEYSAKHIADFVRHAEANPDQLYMPQSIQSPESIISQAITDWMSAVEKKLRSFLSQTSLTPDGQASYIADELIMIMQHERDLLREKAEQSIWADRDKMRIRQEGLSDFTNRLRSLPDDLDKFSSDIRTFAKTPAWLTRIATERRLVVSRVWLIGLAPPALLLFISTLAFTDAQFWDHYLAGHVFGADVVARQAPPPVRVIVTDGAPPSPTS